ncbi:MAG: aspartate aminotransferase family protein [Spirochaetia bacterium]
MKHIQRNSIETNPFADEGYLPNTYAEKLLVLEKGEGCYLEDIAGNRYLDFGAGIAVNALGYGRADITEIITGQAKKLIHTSNLYTSEPVLACAAKLAATGNFDAVHFGNSGSEANEAAIKYARLYANRTRGGDSHRIACFTGGFHGRTLGALSCTPTAKYQDPFRPLIPGVEVLPFNDPARVGELVDSSFAAVIVEVVQGEGGLAVMTPEFASALNDTCAKHDVILIADEVQTGLGRTGEFYASSAVGLKPDIITLAKPLAAGLPLSATLIPEKINSLLHLGDHGTTFGGGPVTTAAASHVLDVVSHPGFLSEVGRKAGILRRGLEELCSRFPETTGGIKGMGLLSGVDLTGTERVASVMEECRKRGLLVLRSGASTVRLAPPLVISDDEIHTGLEVLEDALKSI